MFYAASVLYLEFLIHVNVKNTPCNMINKVQNLLEFFTLEILNIKDNMLLGKKTSLASNKNDMKTCYKTVQYWPFYYGFFLQENFDVIHLFTCQLSFFNTLIQRYVLKIGKHLIQPFSVQGLATAYQNG